MSSWYDAWTDFAGEPLDDDSREYIFVARR